jgi:hypothetical protein
MADPNSLDMTRINRSGTERRLVLYARRRLDRSSSDNGELQPTANQKSRCGKHKANESKGLHDTGSLGRQQKQRAMTSIASNLDRRSNSYGTENSWAWQTEFHWALPRAPSQGTEEACGGRLSREVGLFEPGFSVPGTEPGRIRQIGAAMTSSLADVVANNTSGLCGDPQRRAVRPWGYFGVL